MLVGYERETHVKKSSKVFSEVIGARFETYRSSPFLLWSFSFVADKHKSPILCYAGKTKGNGWLG